MPPQAAAAPEIDANPPASSVAPAESSEEAIHDSPPEVAESQSDGTDDSLLQAIQLLDLEAGYTEPEPETDQPETEEPTAESPADESTEEDEEESSEAPDDPEAEADESDQPETEEPETDQPEGNDKRYDTLVELRDKYRDQRDEARNRVEDLEHQLAELQSGAVSLTPSERNPLADLTTAEAIQARIKEADAVIAWAAANPDGAEFEKDGDIIEFSAAEVAARRLNAEKIKEIHGPKRLQYLDNLKAATAFAKQVYPEMYEAGPFADFADQIITGNPGLLENPNYPCQVGDMIMGAAVRQGIYKIVPVKAAKPAADKSDDPATPAAASPTTTGEKQKPKAAAAAPTPPAQPKPSAPPRRASGQIATSRTRQRFDETGSAEDLAAYLAAS